jgi:hypothetical protein
VSRILPSNTLGTLQMNLLLCDSKPIVLPEDKQRELEMALADLLLSAAVGPREAVEEDQE